MSEELASNADHIRLLQSTANPTDGDKWKDRLKEELLSLISVYAFDK